MKSMVNYYTYVIIITLLALGVLSVLVFENDRISRRKKQLFIATNIFIAISAVAECIGVRISGNAEIPKAALLTVKTIDYIFTPLTGGALIALMEHSAGRKKVLMGIFACNVVFQVTAAFQGWMIVIDNQNCYTHGVFYPCYILFYSLVIITITVKMLSYGRIFRKQNRKSLYATILLVFIGVAMQELLGRDCRVAYLATAFGSAFLFIHYSEFSQLQQDDEISEQQIKISNDALTGVFSRLAYIDALKKYDVCLPEALVVFLIDINGLKAVNDSVGHEAGDELICGAAECIDSTIGRYGRTFRIGGDEFVVFAEMTREQTTVALNALKEKTGNWFGMKTGWLSLSVGYAFALDYRGLSAEELVKKADQKMYQQKKEYYQISGHDRRN